ACPVLNEMRFDSYSKLPVLTQSTAMDSLVARNIITPPTLGPAIPQLPSGNISITEEFFQSKLGFEILAKDIEHKHLIVRKGGAEIHFWQTATEEEAHQLGSVSSCYIRVINIEVLYDEMKDNGTPFRYGLTVQPWGMREVQ